MTWWLLAVAACVAIAFSGLDQATSTGILALRLTKSAVLLAVAGILFRRRSRDPVAAMLGPALLLWIISSSIDFAEAASWLALIDRFRFLLFALALLLFPDGEWRPRWTRHVAIAIVATFALGIVEALGVIQSQLYLPVAIACVLSALAALMSRYRSLEPGVQKQQLKWVTLGLFAGIALILAARAAAALTSAMAMPAIGSVLIEGLFQFGIIILALGFLTSLLRYRLYDAEAAISRSAAYATLTLALVATFAGVESIIELVSQNYLGGSIGNVSGAVAAAVAAVLLTPLHGKISNWAEERFQRDLVILKRQLPDLLTALSGGHSVKQLAATVLPHIEQAVHSTRIALIVDGNLTATHGIAIASARRLLRDWRPPAATGLLSRDDEASFPLMLALRCPLGSLRGWLLLGPRPDGSYFGKDDVEALTEITPALQRTLFLVAERERDNERQRHEASELGASLAALMQRVANLEASRPARPAGN
ncbi:MAG TPA: hypothetical protein VFR36_07555 [Sphingomicrobium sp.]|nr:hypothetical protein [Sphingomicrobium sp.]